MNADVPLINRELVNQCRFFASLCLFLLDYNTHEFIMSRQFTLARIRNLDVTVSLLRPLHCPTSTYKLNHYYESTTMKHGVTFISQ